MIAVVAGLGFARLFGAAPLGAAPLGAPTIGVNPGSGTVGTTVTVSGTGFTANEAVAVADTTASVGPLCTSTTNTSGSWSCAWQIGTIEAAAAGAHTIGAAGNQGSVATTTFTMVAPTATSTATAPPLPPSSTPTAIPTLAALSLQPSSGSVTTNVVASGINFQKHENVSVVDRTTNVGTLCTARADSNGNWTCSWRIGSNEATPTGDHRIVAEGDGGSITTTTLTITSSVAGLGDAGLVVLALTIGGITWWKVRPPDCRSAQVTSPRRDSSTRAPPRGF